MRLFFRERRSSPSGHGQKHAFPENQGVEKARRSIRETPCKNSGKVARKETSEHPSRKLTLNFRKTYSKKTHGFCMIAAASRSIQAPPSPCFCRKKTAEERSILPIKRPCPKACVSAILLFSVCFSSHIKKRAESLQRVFLFSWMTSELTRPSSRPCARACRPASRCRSRWRRRAGRRWARTS